MKLIYIYHSGFMIEADKYILIFDYFKDSVSLSKGAAHSALQNKDKTIYVFSTHSHADHFNKEILTWKEQNENIVYIFSKEILDAGKANNRNIVFLDKIEVFTDNRIWVQAFGSTDLGGSFLVKLDGKSIFHAGDLNNWHWDEESTPEEIKEAEDFYLSELNIVAKYIDNLDLLMFPIDKRLGQNYTKGARQFLEKIKVGLFAPMHFGKDYDSTNAFKAYIEKNGSRFFEINNKGDSISF